MASEVGSEVTRSPYIEVAEQLSTSVTTPKNAPFYDFLTPDEVFVHQNLSILHNIDLNAKDIHGRTPLMETCINGHTDVIKSTNTLMFKYV